MGAFNLIGAADYGTGKNGKIGARMPAERVRRIGSRAENFGGSHSIHTKMSRVVHYVIGATCCFYIPIKYLLTRATAIDDVELEPFIPKEVSMGDYRILLNSIKLIGLNPDDYRRESR